MADNGMLWRWLLKAVRWQCTHEEVIKGTYVDTFLKTHFMENYSLEIRYYINLAVATHPISVVGYSNYLLPTQTIYIAFGATLVQYME